MAIEFWELVESREWSGGSATFHYRLTGTADDATALATVLSSTAPVYQGLIREANPTVEPEWVDTAAGGGAGDGAWKCTVRYVAPDEQEQEESEIGSVRIRGTTKGGTQHVVASLATVGAYGNGAAVGDNGNLVGVTAEGAEGVDISVPVFNFTVAKVWPKTGLPNLGGIYGLTAKTNSAGFTVTDSVTGLTITLNAGECLFLGADFGDARADGGVEFTYEFSALPNRTGLSVGDIGGISKKGWEYLWVRYEPAEVGGLKVLGQKPRAVYVERVYDAGNFAGLGLSPAP